MTGKEAVEAIKSVAPGFNHPLYSKTLRPDHYGIRLTVDALNALGGRRTSRRRKPNKYTWRAGNELKTRLQTAKTALGILTDQEAITVAVQEWLERVEQHVQMR